MPQVGSATVEINADLQKLFAGLVKAKAATATTATAATKSFSLMTAGLTAAGVGLAAFAAKQTTVNTAIKTFGTATVATAAGLRTMVGLLGETAITVARIATNPVGIALFGAVTGHPVLGVATAVASTRAGSAIGKGILSAASFAVRQPLAALALGAGGGILGIAAMGAAAAAGAAGFGALKDAFNEARH